MNFIFLILRFSVSYSTQERIDSDYGTILSTIETILVIKEVKFYQQVLQLTNSPIVSILFTIKLLWKYCKLIKEKSVTCYLRFEIFDSSQTISHVN